MFSLSLREDNWKYFSFSYHTICEIKKTNSKHFADLIFVAIYTWDSQTPPLFMKWCEQRSLVYFDSDTRVNGPPCPSFNWKMPLPSGGKQFSSDNVFSPRWRCREKMALRGVSKSSVFVLTPTDVVPIFRTRSQKSILRNSRLKTEFIPAYMKGLIVFEK